MSKYNPGDTAYIVEAVYMYTLRFTDTGGGVKLREGRLYPSREAAEKSIKEQGR